MSDLLAVFAAVDEDRELMGEIAAYRPDRVTVLIEDDDADLVSEDSSATQALRDRLARLLATIADQTGATVQGMVGRRSQLIGWRFDRELVARTPLPA